ncbi:hypothetical protein HPP92_018465 [Vanilla planifolia]|uniref:ABC transporter domain-containing protein n=1 Tax=Vanilla planifolia TaxID=51239 RepID=A0A835QK31_VANPL|nr:hypothetical protein HPP92_018465 [Vanilla planifolia]
MPLLPTKLCFPVLKPTSATAGSASDPNLVELFHLAAEAGRSGETPSPEHHIDCTPFQLRRSPLFVLSFYELTYAISLRRLPGGHAHCSRRTILDSISGEAREGEILAVMGASGSGKSTLIDGLADRIAKTSLGGGGVCLNGEPLDSKIQKTISAYVMQDDLLFPMLTVEETLNFAAEFRLPRSLSAAKKRARVQALIDQLGLRNASSTIIGDEGHRGVSGGERRRVSIGTDIVHDPILLFLDEPTSGLDSTSAYLVAQVLQRIARTGSVVVTSIHQPSARVLALLDRLMLLSKGRTVFFGRPEELSEFFAGFGRSMPEGENRAEFALDVVRELDVGEGGGNELVEYFRERRRLGLAGGGTTTEFSATPDRTPPSAFSLQAAISASISRGKLFAAASIGATSSATSTEVPQFVNPWFVELAVLTRRSCTNTLRMPELFLMRLAATTITGGILATVFFHLDSSPRGVQERLGFFAFAMSTMYYTCADALPVFLHERYIFLRETAHNAYRRSSYVLSNSLVALPALVLLSVAFAVTTFSAVGLSGSFLFYFLAILASFWAGSGFVTFLSGVVSSVMLGYVIVVAVLAYFLLFSGFFVERDRIPGYWIWFHYLSLVKYPYEGVLRNEFGAEGKCFVRGLQVFDVTPLRGMTDEAKEKVLTAIGRSLGVNILSDTCLTTGVDVLTQNAVTQLGKWWCLGVTVAWGFLFRVFFYLALLFGSGRNKRK